MIDTLLSTSQQHDQLKADYLPAASQCRVTADAELAFRARKLPNQPLSPLEESGWMAQPQESLCLAMSDDALDQLYERLRFTVFGADTRRVLPAEVFSFLSAHDDKAWAQAMTTFCKASIGQQWLVRVYGDNPEVRAILSASEGRVWNTHLLELLRHALRKTPYTVQIGKVDAHSLIVTIAHDGQMAALVNDETGRAEPLVCPAMEVSGCLLLHPRASRPSGAASDLEGQLARCLKDSAELRAAFEKGTPMPDAEHIARGLCLMHGWDYAQAAALEGRTTLSEMVLGIASLGADSITDQIVFSALAGKYLCGEQKVWNKLARMGARNRVELAAAG